MSLLWKETFEYRGEECIAQLAEEESEKLRWNSAVVSCQVRGVTHIDRRSTERKWGLWWFERAYVGEEEHMEQAIEDFKTKIDLYEENIKGGEGKSLDVES